MICTGLTGKSVFSVLLLLCESADPAAAAAPTVLELFLEFSQV